MKSNPSWAAAQPVEPEPMKGSSTTPPGGVTNLTSHAITPMGLTVGWSLRTLPLWSPFCSTSDQSSCPQVGWGFEGSADLDRDPHWLHCRTLEVWPIGAAWPREGRSGRPALRSFLLTFDE